MFRQLRTIGADRLVLKPTPIDFRRLVRIVLFRVAVCYPYLGPDLRTVKKESNPIENIITLFLHSAFFASWFEAGVNTCPYRPLTPEESNRLLTVGSLTQATTRRVVSSITLFKGSCWSGPTSSFKTRCLARCATTHRLFALQSIGTIALNILRMSACLLHCLTKSYFEEFQRFCSLEVVLT